MRDLKQRLFDLLRSGGISVGDNNNGSSTGVPQSHQQQQQHHQQTIYSPIQPVAKPKKLHEYTAADCNAAFLRKYHDLSISRAREGDTERQQQQNQERQHANVIYFNENLSMTSKYNVRQFPLTRYPSCPLSSFGMSSQRGAEGSAGSSLAEDTESDRYNFCSDEDQSSNARTLKIRCRKLRMDADVDISGNGDGDVDADLDLDDHAESQLDSFCTLCTSTFSYNKCCRFCDNSLCGSKCNSERGSHASRISCHLNGYAGVDNDNDNVDCNVPQIQFHQHPHQSQERYALGGSSMKILTGQKQPKVATATAIK
ncbi:hypothetical protein ACLKA7_007226 [Drosophila subpalustris]